MQRSTIGAATAMALALLIAGARQSGSAAQATAEPAWTLNQQKTAVTAKFPTTPTATLTLNAAEVDKMIDVLAQLRAAMQPPRPVGDPAPGTTINVATAGRWWVQPDGTGIDLAVLHPGYGWVGLQLDQAAIEQLNRRLGARDPPGAGAGETQSHEHRYEHR